MRGRGLVLCGVTLLWAGVAEAGGLELAWSYPAGWPDVQFTITATPAQGSTSQVAAGAGQGCSWVKGATAETRCVSMACPPAGIYTYWVTAQQGAQETNPSNLLTCNVVTTAKGCTCEVLDDTPGPDQTAREGEALLRAGVAVETPAQEDAPAPEEAAPAPPAPVIVVPVMGAVGNLGNSLVVSWAYPRTGATPPARFIVGMQSATMGTPALLAVPLHGQAACSSVEGAGGDTWCARVSCPGAGVWRFWVQADHGGPGAPSASVPCTIQPGAACVCTPGVSVVHAPA